MFLRSITDSHPAISRLPAAPSRGRPSIALVGAIVLTCLLMPSHAASAACWQPPVVGRIVEPFRAPACPYCSGNRGLEYRVGADMVVRSVAAGTVTYSGSIAGTRYVVVDLANGWKVTYGRLTSSSIRRGDRIGRGAVVGRVSHEFYLGLRIAGEYRDPAPHLGRLTGRPRLVPVDGTPRRPPPAPVLTCPSGATDRQR